MKSTEVSSHEFRSLRRLEKLPDKGPVVITGRGVRSPVPLSCRDYKALESSREKSLLQAIAQPGPADAITFDPLRVRIDSRSVKFG